MIPGPFEYAAPASLDEAIGLLQQHGYDAKVLAGGQSLIPMMRFRLAEPAVIVDISHVPGLDQIEERNGHLSIGAMVREVATERSSLIRERYPIIYDATEMIADPLVRNLATMGGNLAHCDPGNDHPAAILAVRGTMVGVGPNGERTFDSDEFFVDSFTTALEPDEILTEVRIPASPARSGGAYSKLERKVGDYAVAATAAYVVLAEDGTVAEAGLGLTNASYRPMRAARAEQSLVGRQPDEDATREAAEIASQEAEPSADLRGTVDYKRAMIRTMTRRALAKAIERARANG